MKQVLFFISLLFLVSFTNAQLPGTVDVTFNPNDKGFGFGDGSNDYVKDILIQSEGKVIIGGDFTTYNTNTAKSLARINADGSFDSTFKIGSGANSYVASFIAQPDGKLIICGSFTSFNGVVKNRITRLNSDGSTDATFNIGNGADNVIECVALQTDGKIIIGGQFTKFNDVSRRYIARLNTDGSLDTTFDSSIGFNSHVYSIAVQSDGKIFAGGNFTTYNSITKNYIVKLNSDASIDESFISSGTNNIVYKVLISNEKIFLGGKFTKYNNITKNGIVKLNDDATIDETFLTGSGANNIVRNILVLNDNKIMLAGDFTAYSGVPRNYITKINENGSLDTSFTPGKAFGNSTTSLQQQSDGKLLIGGSFLSFNNNTKHYISRINLDGSLDKTFNPGNGADNIVRAIAVQLDKKMVVGGYFNSYNDHTSNTIARIDSEGNVDESWQTGSGADKVVRALAVQEDSKIIAGGDFEDFNGIAKSYFVRLNSLGTIDNTFAIGYGPSDPVRDIRIQSDGKILVCGDFSVFNTKTANHILRLNSDGTIDTTFAPVSGSNNAIYSMKLQSDGKIIIVGTFTTYDGVSRNRIARLNPNGTLDTTFAVGTGANNTVSSLAIQTDGKIIFGGNFTTYNGAVSTRIVRVNSTGSRDTSFVSGVGANASVESLLLQENGKVLIAGSFTKYNNITSNYIARLSSTGAFDTTFNNSGTAANKAIYKLVSQDNKYIAIGDFTSYNGFGRNRITRIFGGEEEHLNSANFNSNSKTKIYPNPTSDKLFISSSLDLVRYEVYDFAGQKLLDKFFDSQSKTADVSHLKKGVYILKLIDNNQKALSSKFILE
ncbi:MAG: hypothetical protein DI529_06795 [Chryseobacterium sp.]|nr:MAG: hypothetical protein DI529_06795 [Chryseobacterium sp.]